MMPQGFGYNPRSTEHHWMLASFAVLLSAFSHLLLLYLFADYSLSRTDLAERTRKLFTQEYTPPMSVEAIRIDPLSLPEKIPGERDIPNRASVEIKALESATSQETSAGLTAPPPLPREALTVESQPLKRSVEENPFIPRQEIYDLHDQNIKKELSSLPIRELPKIERIPKALDIVPQLDLSGKQGVLAPEPPALTRTDILTSALARGPLVMPHTDNLDLEMALSRFGSAMVKMTPPPELPRPPITLQPTDRLPPEERKIIETQNTIEKIRETVKYASLDEMLSASLVSYTEGDSLFFKLILQPKKEKPIGIIPKDIIWVLDVSGSMTEERLTFCRRAFIKALETMNPQDRFTVLAFRDSIFYAFPEWQAISPDSIKKATSFVEGLRSFGSTDVLASLNSLITLPRDPARPMIAMLVSDGKPTAGMTQSSGIIAAFSRLNRGMVSVYSFGTHRSANAYLLDMLTYCNRGDSTIIQGNRWDIPDNMAPVYLGFRNPILSDASIIFDATSNSEVYPRRTSNLYLDRPLEVYGKCNATEKEVVFQIRGLAGDRGYDSIFRLPLATATQGNSELKTRWASQKMFYLASLYARDSEDRLRLIQSIQALSKNYNIAPLYPSDIK
jgi:hypothetical protein